MIITLSGTPGSGKSVLAKRIAKTLNLKHYYMGQFMRDQAKTKGMDILSYLKYLEEHPQEEKEIDLIIQKKGESEDDFIIEGRVAFHFIPNSIKVYLDVDPKVGASRIFNELQTSEKRNEKKFETVEEVIAYSKGRMESEKKRYLDLYHLNTFNTAQFDIVLDTTGLNADQVYQKILKHIQEASS